MLPFCNLFFRMTESLDRECHAELRTIGDHVSKRRLNLGPWGCRASCAPIAPICRTDPRFPRPDQILQTLDRGERLPQRPPAMLTRLRVEGHMPPRPRLDPTLPLDPRPRRRRNQPPLTSSASPSEASCDAWTRTRTTWRSRVARAAICSTANSWSAAVSLSSDSCRVASYLIPCAIVRSRPPKQRVLIGMASCTRRDR